MSVSMGVKCGSCFAQWNGNTWVDSYKCMVSLKSWSLKMNDSYQLCLEGYCDLDIILEVCVPITDRLTNFFVTGQGILVKFDGVLNQKNLPDYIVKKFSHGIPDDWKEVSIKWGEYIQRGKESTFCWELSPNPARSLTSLSSSRSSRRRGLRGEGKNAKPQEKIAQQKQTAPLKTSYEHRDSGNPTSNENSNAPQKFSTTESSNSRSRLLPPEKLRDINKWIHSSYDVNSDSSLDVENESTNTESFLRLLQGHASFTSQTSESTRCTSDLPISVENTSLPRVRPLSPQSTPVVSISKARKMADVFNLDISAIADISHSDISVQYSNAATDVFRKPTQVLPASKINSMKSNVQSTSNFTKRDVPKTVLSKTLPERSCKISKLPRNQIVRKENPLSLRPRRKLCQKIERWRPVLGVDGNLKVQGYLLLGGDMTACQILTTNTVTEWGDRKVYTCDRREFELVGDSCGKIPDNLKSQLLKPMDCEDIIKKLKKIQSIKEDVTSCLHLAPPPAPTTITTTRSGRLCRPCTPYWLNRSDWGAEYDMFYEEDKSCRSSNSIAFQGRSRDVRTSPQNPTARHIQTVSNQAFSSRNISQARRSFSDTHMKSNVTALPSTLSQNAFFDSPGLQNGRMENRSFLHTVSSTTPLKRKSLRIGRKKQNDNKSDSSLDDSDRLPIAKSREIPNSPVMKQIIGTLNQSFEHNNHVRSDPNLKQTHLVKQNQMMMPSARLQDDSTIVHFSPSRIKVSYIEKSVNRNVHSTPVNVQSVTNELNSSCETPKRPSRSPVKRPCFPCSEATDSFTRKHSYPQHSNPCSISRRKKVPDSETTRSQSEGRNLIAQQTRTSCRTRALKIPDDKTPAKSQINTRSKGSGNVNKSRRGILSEARILLQRIDTKKFVSGGIVQKNELSEKVSAAFNTPNEKRKRNTQKSEAESNPAKESQRLTREQQKTIEKNRDEDLVKGKGLTCGKRKSVGKKKVTLVRKSEAHTMTNKKKANQRKETKVKKNVLKTNGKIKTAQKSRQGQNQKNRVNNSDKESDRMEDSASVCSETSEISLGPSASVIFAMNTEMPTPRRAPRTLKERRMRDEELVKLGKKLASRESIAADDDPMANLISAQKFAAFPQEWCHHENFLRKHRKRRHPSSSEGTVSPRSGVSDNYGNEDATSSVATPQLLMRQPNQKQVQSYLQRQRALIARAQRPTRQLKKDRQLILPVIDYSAPFRKHSDSSEESSDASESEWEG